MKERLKQLMAEYGRLAVAIYLSIFALSIAAFWTAITLGFQVDGVAGGTGTFVAAYLATKAIQPLRIGATLALTPILNSYLSRLRSQPVPLPVRVESE